MAQTNSRGDYPQIKETRLRKQKATTGAQKTGAISTNSGFNIHLLYIEAIFLSVLSFSLAPSIFSFPLLATASFFTTKLVSDYMRYKQLEKKISAYLPNFLKSGASEHYQYLYGEKLTDFTENKLYDLSALAIAVLIMINLPNFTLASSVLLFTFTLIASTHLQLRNYGSNIQYISGEVLDKYTECTSSSEINPSYKESYKGRNKGCSSASDFKANLSGIDLNSYF